MSGFSPEFWQRLLASEVSTAKSQAILNSLGTLLLKQRNLDPITYLLQGAGLSEAETRKLAAADLKALRAALESGAFVLEASQYPENLLRQQGHPPALFCKGDADALHQPTVGIVGTRNATTYGKAVAQKFAERLAKSGVTIVSGGALGIDAAAHRGALQVGGKTAAVLGTGIEGVFPARHGPLFDQIRVAGCLVSQWACGGKVYPQRFVARNHLIAGLCSAILLVEAPEVSGSLVTARVAAELGRPVFVVPANIDNVNYRGSHGLIRDGATLVDHPDQILDSLDIALGLEEMAPEIELSDSQRRIVGYLSVEPLPPEKIVASTGLDPSEVLSELTLLEIEGIVIHDAGGYALRP